MDIKLSRIARGALLCAALPARAQMLLVPMDDAQRNHLKAYGLVYNALKDGQKAEYFRDAGQEILRACRALNKRWG